MRKLMWFTLGFGPAMAVWAYGLAECFGAVFLAAFLPGLLLCLFARKKRILTVLSAVLLGVSLGTLWFSQFDRLVLTKAAALDGETKTITIRATDYSYDTSYGLGVDGIYTENERSYRVRAYLDEGAPIAPGDKIAGTFRFRLTASGGDQDPTYHKGRGIYLLLYAQDAVTVTKGEPGLRDFPAVLRHRLQSILTDSFPRDAAPFAKALLLGDTRDFDYETECSFRISGIRHVVAVSGLHVSILFGLLSLVTFRKRVLTALAGFPLLFLFAALAGFTPSIQRACLMFSLVLLAKLLDKDYDGPTALSFAVLVMLAVNPLTVTDVGFQLSLSSVSGIYLFYPRIYGWFMRKCPAKKSAPFRYFLAKSIFASVSLTLSATALTTPLCAIYFGTVSLIGVVTNLLVLWLISFLFYGILIVCLLGFFWTAGANFIAICMAWPIRFVLFAAKTLAKFPLAAVYTRSPYIAAWLIFVYILLFAFCFGKRRPKVLLCCGTLGLCMALLASWAEPLRNGAQLTVLDVGQGQCLLFQSQGKTYMVDCGGSDDQRTADIAAETLLSQGIYRLDGLILTHLDRDHEGAVENLLTRVDTDLLILPPTAKDYGTQGRIVCATDDLRLSFGETTISIFAPHSAGDRNENSLCVLFDSEKCDILVTGDRGTEGEKELLEFAELPEVDVLIAGHHGGKNATSDALLAAVRPKIVCISLSENNSYGHPAPETLERIRNYGCIVYRTDENGDIRIRR